MVAAPAASRARAARVRACARPAASTCPRGPSSGAAWPRRPAPRRRRSVPAGRSSVTDPGVLRRRPHRCRRRSLRGAGLEVSVFDHVQPNPRDVHCVEGADAARAAGADVLVGVGGGSAIDTAKCIGVLLTNGGHPRDSGGLRRARPRSGHGDRDPDDRRHRERGVALGDHHRHRPAQEDEPLRPAHLPPGRAGRPRSDPDRAAGDDAPPRAWMRSATPSTRCTVAWQRRRRMRWRSRARGWSASTCGAPTATPTMPRPAAAWPRPASSPASPWASPTSPASTAWPRRSAPSTTTRTVFLAGHDARDHRVRPARRSPSRWARLAVAFGLDARRARRGSGQRGRRWMRCGAWTTTSACPRWRAR